jgi:hypothetical protein
MVRRIITLQIEMIAGDAANVRDKFYYGALQEEVILRIHNSLFYQMWRQFRPAAQEEYEEFEWFWGYLGRRGEYIGRTVRGFVSSLVSKNMNAYTLMALFVNSMGGII